MNSSTLEPGSPQHDFPATCVIAQQYSHTTFVSLRFQSREENFDARFKTSFNCPYFIKLR
jgi:hypothetical protein